MHLDSYTIEDIYSFCHNILALTEALDITDKKDEAIILTERIRENISNIKDSIDTLDINIKTILNDNQSLKSDVEKLIKELDDIEMELEY